MPQYNVEHWYYTFRLTPSSSTKQAIELLNDSSIQMMNVNNRITKVISSTSYQMVPFFLTKKTIIIGTKIYTLSAGTFTFNFLSTTSANIHLSIIRTSTNSTTGVTISGSQGSLRTHTVSLLANDNYEFIITQSNDEANQSLYLRTMYTGDHYPEHKPYLGSAGYTVVSPSTPVSVGDYKYSARTADFDGWLLCDGRAVSREDYAHLFEVIGTYFGEGDESTTFNLPDNRGRVAGSIGEGSGLTNRTLGTSVGNETHTLTSSEMPPHQHSGTTGNSGNHNHTYQDAYFAEFGGHKPNGSVYGTSANTDTDNGFIYRTANGSWSTSPADLGTSSNGEHSHNFTTASTGGGGAHNNMQPTLFVGNLFICAEV